MDPRPSPYTNLVIYYFSGTGNARKTAEWIIHAAKERGLNTRMINIDRFREVTWPEMPEGRTLAGFCYPTHGFCVPPIVEKYIRHFPPGKDADVFLVNTRAGMKMGRLFLPGYSGIALLWPAILLKAKEYRIITLRSVDLPSNWISLHPGLMKKVVISIYDRWKEKIRQTAEGMLDGKKNYSALVSLPLDLAITPLSIGYFFLGRFHLARTYIVNDDCNNCGICLKRCPVEAISMKDDRPYWSYRCESCMRCMNHCPKRAIETPHSFAVLWFYFIWSALPTTVLIWLVRAGIIPNFEPVYYTLVWWLVAIPLSFLMLYLSYRVLHYLMKFRIVNRFVILTSLTHYRFWRRYKAPEGY